MTVQKPRRKSAKIRGEKETILDAAIGWDQASMHKGRGVFARRALKKGEIVEIAPVIPLSRKNIRQNGEAPDGYLLMWDEDTAGMEYCMPLGYVMLYNHSTTPNIGLSSDYRRLTMTVKTLRPVAKGEELVWDYKCELWFDES